MTEETNDIVVYENNEILPPVAVEEEITEAERELVNNAVTKITTIFSDHFSNAMYEIGEYLISEFYDNNYELAKEKKPAKAKCFARVIDELRAKGEKKPSRSWLHNAIDLIVDKKAIGDFHSYGNLSLSHKVLLFPEKNVEIKKSLAEKAYTGNLTVSQFRDLIKGNKKAQDASVLRFLKDEKSVNTRDIEEIFTDFNILHLPEKKLDKVKETVQDEIKEIEANINDQKIILEKYKAIKAKLDKVAKKGKPKI